MINARNEIVIDGKTFWFGWDNPTQSFFLDGENPEPDPCKQCVFPYSTDDCPENCHGHYYCSTINIAGPIVGGRIDDWLLFASILFDSTGMSETQAIRMARMCQKYREARATVNPRTTLQLDIEKLFKTLEVSNG